MSGWIRDIINGTISKVLDTITAAALSALNWVLGLLNDNIFHSPDLTRLPQVIEISGRAQVAANAAMTLIVVVVGVIAMTHGTVQDRHTLKDLLPRMVIGFAMANLAGPIVRAVVAAGNAVTDALAGGSFDNRDSFTAIRRTVADVTTNPNQFLVALVLQLVVVWLLIFIVITWLGRLSVLLIVAATGPAALLCHAIPFAEPIARIWWRSLLSCLGVQVLQAVTLHMAVATLLVPGASLPALGLPDDPTGLFNLLVACFLLWMVVRIPKWVSSTFGGPTSRSGTILGSIVRLVVVQRVLGAVGVRGGSRRLIGRRPGLGAGGGGVRLPASQFHHHAAPRPHLHMHPPGSTRPYPYRGPAALPQAGRPPQTLRNFSAPGPRRGIGPNPSAHP